MFFIKVKPNWGCLDQIAKILKVPAEAIKNFDCGNAALLNKELKRQYRLLEDLIDLVHEKPIDDKGRVVAEIYHPTLDLDLLRQNEAFWLKREVKRKSKTQLDVYTQLREYIKTKENNIAPASISIIKNLEEHLKKYEQHYSTTITFDSFDFTFYTQYVEFLTHHYVQERTKAKTKGLRQNSISKDVKCLRRFLKDRAKHKIISAIDLSDYKAPEEDTDAIYLTFGEISAIYNLDLTYNLPLHLDKCRIVFLCLTGLRFSDIVTIIQCEIRSGNLHIVQEKTSGKIIIPLRKEAEEIFAELLKYNLFTSNPEFNKNVKIIGKLAGITEMISFSFKKGNKVIKETKAKCDWITSHTGRRSFCTNEFLAGTPIKLIMMISGHKKEKDFYKYIRITKEEAAEIMKNIWQARNCIFRSNVYQRSAANLTTHSATKYTTLPLQTLPLIPEQTLPVIPPQSLPPSRLLNGNTG